MSRVAQASDNRPAAFFSSACLKAALVAASATLAGCGAGGFSLEKAEVDRTILTGSVSTNGTPTDSDMAADQSIIRNAVSAADLSEQAGQPIPWANADTGSRGSIDELAEYRERGQLCRRFTTTREAYNGVSMFKGAACQAGPGAWTMQDFKAI